MKSVKKGLVSILTSSLMGGFIEIITQNKIRFNNVWICTDYSEISNYIKACLFWGLYEKQEAKFIQKYISNDLPVIELGASIGVISCITARKVFPQNVYSVEASPSLIRIIENNLKLNQIDNCKVLNLALGSNTEVFFTPGKDNTVGTISDNRNENSVSVKCLPLSGIASSLKLQKFNLICDIEGSETDFLFGDPESLMACELMIIELHDTVARGNWVSAERLKERIVALGFSLLDSHGPVVVAKRS